MNLQQQKQMAGIVGDVGDEIRNLTAVLGNYKPALPAIAGAGYMELLAAIDHQTTYLDRCKAVALADAAERGDIGTELAGILRDVTGVIRDTVGAQRKLLERVPAGQYIELAESIAILDSQVHYLVRAARALEALALSYTGAEPVTISLNDDTDAATYAAAAAAARAAGDV